MMKEAQAPKLVTKHTHQSHHIKKKIPQKVLFTLISLIQMSPPPPSSWNLLTSWLEKNNIVSIFFKKKQHPITNVQSPCLLHLLIFIFLIADHIFLLFLAGLFVIFSFSLTGRLTLLGLKRKKFQTQGKIWE